MTNQNLKLFSKLKLPLTTLLLVISCRFAVAVSFYTHYRLPVSLQPDRYQLRVITHLDDPENLTFDGQVSIRFQVLEDTNNITLHAKNLTIDDSRIQLKSYEDDDFHLCLVGVETMPEQDYYIIRLCQSLLKGQMYKVKLDFSGILNDRLEGYYRSSYVDETTNETRWLSVTQFESIRARRAFPCFDEPNYKARFVIWLGHQKSLTALSNMPREKQIPLDELEDYVWSIFEESVPMSTYLVAYTVNDFAFKQSQLEGSDVVFRTWCRPDYIDQCNYASKLAPTILQYYENMYGIKYPLKKMDQIAVPDFAAGAMENWGLITYKEENLLYDPKVSSQSKKDTIVTIISHEMAHQWFGNLVTMKWWTDVWLNEGFATYVQSLAIQYLMPELEMYNKEAIKNSLLAFRSDDTLAVHPVSQPIVDAKELEEHRRAITTIYNKASNVIRMMHSFLGPDEFFEGIRNYLAEYKYRNAEQDDLWAAFNEIAHKNNRIQPQHDMKTIMDSWTLQPGYPVVKVNRNYESGSIDISQQRFFVNSTISEEESDKCWWVPLSYTTASELDFMTMTSKAWMECDDSGKSINLKLDNVTGAKDWILFNIQLSGVYRVMYDTANWRLIQETLNSNRFTDIHVMNRAHLLEDVLYFAWNSYIGYEIVFDILEYLTREREFLPWDCATDHLYEIYLIFEKFPQHYSHLKSYLRNILEPIYFYAGGLNATVGTTMTNSDTSLQNLVSIWACRMDLEDCVQAAIDYFRQWKLTQTPDEVNHIPVDLREAVYCTAMHHGDSDDWTFLWQRYKGSASYIHQIEILNSLGCSRNATVLKDFLHLLIDTDVPAEHIESAFSVISGSDIGFSLALEYYIEHISELHSAGIDVVSLLTDLSYDVTSAEEKNKLISLTKSHHEYFKESEKQVSDAVRSMNFNLQWIESNLENISSDIQRRLSLSGITKDNVIEQ